jgi:hypothetical protein
MSIRKLLLKKCLEPAEELRAKGLILFSNSQLKAALGLLEKYSFQHAAVAGAPCITANVKMERIR